MAPDPDLIRVAVLAELANSGMTRYGLWQAMGRRASKTTLYRWLGRRGTIASDTAGDVLDVLGFTITTPHARARPAQQKPRP